MSERRFVVSFHLGACLLTAPLLAVGVWTPFVGSAIAAVIFVPMWLLLLRWGDS